jgi:hypothetical protein
MLTGLRLTAWSSFSAAAHFAGFEAPAELDEAVCQRGLAVIDVRDDRKIADQLHQVGWLGRKGGGL